MATFWVVAKFVTLKIKNNMPPYYQADLNKTRPVVYIYDNVQREGEGERERERDIWPKLGGDLNNLVIIS